MTVESETLAKIAAAEARIGQLQTGQMATFDVGPPRTDTTQETIKAEQAAIASLRRGLFEQASILHFGAERQKMDVVFEHYVTSRAHVAAGGAYGEAFLVPGETPPAGDGWEFRGRVSLPRTIKLRDVKTRLANFPFGVDG
jgi:hypothetical protein